MPKRETVIKMERQVVKMSHRRTKERGNKLRKSCEKTEMNGNVRLSDSRHEVETS